MEILVVVALCFGAFCFCAVPCALGSGKRVVFPGTATRIASRPIYDEPVMFKAEVLGFDVDSMPLLFEQVFALLLPCIILWNWKSSSIEILDNIYASM